MGELWRPAGGAYNVDNVLCVMVSGLEPELKARMAGDEVSQSKGYPSPAVDIESLKSRSIPNDLPLQQGGDISIPIKRLAGWVRRCRASSQ